MRACVCVWIQNPFLCQDQTTMTVLTIIIVTREREKKKERETIIVFTHIYS